MVESNFNKLYDGNSDIGKFEGFYCKNTVPLWY